MEASYFKNKKVAILGFGLEGKDAAQFLLEKGAEITILDRKEEKDLDFSTINKSKIKIICGENYLRNGLVNYDYVFRSPGVYRFIPEIVEAEKKGVMITSDIKLFFDLCPGKIIGVTGTKGKGTTSSLVYQILKKSGYKAYLAGNIGTPPLELLPKLNEDSWLVLELSSFQLINLTRSPYIAVVLNITTDHLDWHKDRNEYIDAKKNILKYQKPYDYAVINYDYATPKSFVKFTKGEVFYFSKKDKVKGCFIRNKKIYLSDKSEEIKIGETEDLLLKGEHNWENICAAICASRIAGANIKSIKNTVFSFRGLEHRLELVGKYKGISFYNDSFSTNPQTTIAAVNAFTEPITLILGGYDKGLDYDEMGEIISKKKNVINIILIGDTALKIKNSLLKARFKGNIIEMDKKSMKDIVKICIQNTLKEGVVLLSPASASFDMFKDCKERGKLFKKEVKSYG